MPEQKIVITIDEEGSITAKTTGFKGESCLSALDELLELDGAVSSIKKTDEFHQEAVSVQNSIQKLRGGSC
ncbi:DUF2997 domain-containing protein [Vibrio parahaemolyticus]|uniref:DUF2997 domain-containing protein n=1 Tax=Vibrio parahaemolyticus TaxID=670 RepID=UPI0007B6CD30|nr:DUF2997 domain-containing protein [Vibrio parahaemolyticus]ANC00169.1 hypothetical protein FORC14_4472 [Vibrio parahaemolyticus]